MQPIAAATTQVVTISNIACRMHFAVKGHVKSVTKSLVAEYADLAADQYRAAMERFQDDDQAPFPFKQQFAFKTDSVPLADEVGHYDGLESWLLDPHAPSHFFFLEGEDRHQA